jgi:ribosomal protein S3
VKIIVKAARPGLVIGRGGKGIEELSEHIMKAPPHPRQGL